MAYLQNTDTRSDVIDISSVVAPMQPIRWLEVGGAQAVAADEALALVMGGHIDAAGDRLERLYSGLYRAWHEDWGMRPMARLELQDRIYQIELATILAWIDGKPSGRGSAQRVLHLVACCLVILQRVRGRRPGTRRSARDMHECHPYQPSMAVSEAQKSRSWTGAIYSRIDHAERRASYRTNISRITRAEEILADEDLPDDLDERDIVGGDERCEGFYSETLMMANGWNGFAAGRKAPKKRNASPVSQYVEEEDDAA